MHSLFGTGLWQADHPLHRSRIGKRVLHLLRVFAFAWKSFWADELLIRATALAYATILSIVPLLAVAFALYSAFPGLSDVYEQMRTVIYQYLAAGASETVVESLDRFISNVHSGAVAGIGTALLFLAVIGLMGAIEYSFNTIWSVRQGRKLIDRVMYYISIIVVGPLLIGLSLRTIIRSVVSEIGAIGIVERSVPSSIWATGVSLFSSVLAISVLYIVIPNTKVKWRAALAGGLLAGVLFEMAKAAYTFYVTNVINYSAIYGAVGAIPVLIVWVYLIWLVVLFGGEFAYAWQNVDLHRLKLAHSDTSQSFHEWLAVSICVVVVRVFDRSEPGPSLERLSEMFSIPPELAQRIVDKLDAAGIVAATDRGHLPSRDPRITTLSDIIVAMRNGSEEEIKARKRGDPVVDAVLDQFECESFCRYGGVTLEELAKAESVESLTAKVMEKAAPPTSDDAAEEVVK